MMRKIACNETEVLVPSFVVCAEPGSRRQAGCFVEKVLGNAKLRSFADLQRRAPAQPILVYLTNPDYNHLRSLLEVLNPGSVFVPKRRRKVIFGQTRRHLGPISHGLAGKRSVKLSKDT